RAGGSGGGAVADPVARARPELARAVVRVGQAAAGERQAAAPDALGQAVLQAPQLGDPFVDPRAPARRETRPVAPGRRAVRRGFGELGADLVEGEADLLGEDDERDAPQDRPPVAAVARARALGGDEALVLVEAQRAGRHAAAAGDLADGEQIARRRPVRAGRVFRLAHLT